MATLNDRTKARNDAAEQYQQLFKAKEAHSKANQLLRNSETRKTQLERERTAVTTKIAALQTRLGKVDEELATIDLKHLKDSTNQRKRQMDDMGSPGAIKRACLTTEEEWRECLKSSADMVRGWESPRQ